MKTSVLLTCVCLGGVLLFVVGAATPSGTVPPGVRPDEWLPISEKLGIAITSSPALDASQVIVVDSDEPPYGLLLPDSRTERHGQGGRQEREPLHIPRCVSAKLMARIGDEWCVVHLKPHELSSPGLVSPKQKIN